MTTSQGTTDRCPTCRSDDRTHRNGVPGTFAHGGSYLPCTDTWHTQGTTDPEDVPCDPERPDWRCRAHTLLRAEVASLRAQLADAGQCPDDPQCVKLPGHTGNCGVVLVDPRRVT